jgi:hypothetical protein
LLSMVKLKLPRPKTRIIVCFCYFLDNYDHVHLA